MGNCLAIEGKVIKIIKKDGEVLQYSAPLQVQHVLSVFEGHVIAESPAASHHLQPGAHLRGGRLYHLLPVSSPEPAETQQSPVFTSTALKDRAGTCYGRSACGGGRLIRVKLVVTKQQLADMLNKGVSMDDMISGQWKGTCDYDQSFDSPNSRGWTPSLRSIPEASDELLELS
ncbi:uncharacterized protein LOC116267139 [Nymphaea colorata]|uniref:Uncharacterized protein n=1 Tax=Nymphaea colorata TaxID=210225 RepID=A0A5K0YWR9_9MAGN|nr:uncharacterized protein LOC116267139 [Nymphaea colorata]